MYRLPPELLAAILDRLTFAELLPALGVCTRWRELAEKSPAFWRDISLPQAGNCAPELFIRRVLAAAGRSFTLALNIPASSQLNFDILPYVAEHLPHIESLDIILPFSTCQHLFDSLRRHPAPLLRSLSLTIVVEDPEADLPVLPSDILCGNPCPVLTSVRLENINVLAHDALPAFSHVRSVQLGSATRPFLRDAPDVFMHFPSMCTLGLYGSTFCNLPAFEDPAMLAKLARVELAGSSQSVALSTWRLGSVQHAVFHGWTNPSYVRAVLGKSPWDRALPMHMVLEHFQDSALDVRLGDAGWTWSRTFREAWTPLRILHTLSKTFGVAGHILGSLTLPVSLWPAASRHLHGVEALTELRLVGSSLPKGRAEDRVYEVKCPNLRILALRSESDRGSGIQCAPIAPLDVAQFVAVSLAGVQFPIQLRLEDLALNPEDKRLTENFLTYFSHIEHRAGSGSTWSYIPVKEALERDYMPSEVTR